MRKFLNEVQLAFSFAFVGQHFICTKYPPLPDPTGVQIFEKIDNEASVDAEQWIKHITKNLQDEVKKAAKKGMKPGTYIVNVRFIVEKR